MATLTYLLVDAAQIDGHIAKVTDGTKLTIASGFDPKSHSYTNEVEGGAMVVVSGAGAGQYKRIVSWPGSINGTSGVFEIDSPLAAPLDATSVVEVITLCVSQRSVVAESVDHVACAPFCGG